MNSAQGLTSEKEFCVLSHFLHENIRLKLKVAHYYFQSDSLSFIICIHCTVSFDVVQPQ